MAEFNPDFQVKKFVNCAPEHFLREALICGDLLTYTTGGQGVKSREFEPDAPNLTPRISGYITFENNDFSYEMSILKSADPEGTACNRYTFSYPSLAGLGHFIHTYVTDGNPIPTFQGEPERVSIPDDIDAFTENLWTNLNEDNKISLYVRYTNLKNGEKTERLINKNS